MDPAITVMIAMITLLVTVGIPLFVKELKDIRKIVGDEVKEMQKDRKEDLKEANEAREAILGKCNTLLEKITGLSERQTISETKLDIFLDHEGFDIHKVNKSIKEHIEELKKNDRPSVGCINTKEMRKEPGE